MTEQAPLGRDIFVDGRQEPAALGALFAAALGLGPSAVVVAGEWDLLGTRTGGIVQVWPLAPGGDFAFKLAIDLEWPIDIGLFPPLARQHGLTVAWAEDESLSYDWHVHVATPGGLLLRRWIEIDEVGDSYRVHLWPPKPTLGTA